MTPESPDRRHPSEGELHVVEAGQVLAGETAEIFAALTVLTSRLSDLASWVAGKATAKCSLVAPRWSEKAAAGPSECAAIVTAPSMRDSRATPEDVAGGLRRLVEAGWVVSAYASVPTAGPAFVGLPRAFGHNDLVAIAGVVPAGAVLEVHTVKADLRAARFGELAIAVELAEGGAAAVDAWLDTLRSEHESPSVPTRAG